MTIAFCKVLNFKISDDFHPTVVLSPVLAHASSELSPATLGLSLLSKVICIGMWEVPCLIECIHRYIQDSTILTLQKNHAHDQYVSPPCHIS